MLIDLRCRARQPQRHSRCLFQPGLQLSRPECKATGLGVVRSLPLVVELVDAFDVDSISVRIAARADLSC